MSKFLIKYQEVIEADSLQDAVSIFCESNPDRGLMHVCRLVDGDEVRINTENMSYESRAVDDDKHS